MKKSTSLQAVDFPYYDSSRDFTSANQQEQRIQSALPYINSLPRDNWLTVAMGLKSELGEAGFPIFIDWSKSAESYNERDALSVWRSIKLGGRVTIGSVFYLAKQSGWRDTMPKPSADDVAERRKIASIAAERAERERLERQLLQAESARIIWKQAGQADPSHPYLVRKRIKPHGVRQIGHSLLIPMLDMEGTIWNLQSIDPTGKKLFRAGRASGLFVAIGGNPDGTSTLVICEGFATGATLHEQTGFPVLCALSASNIVGVALAARALKPEGDLLICGDDDRDKPDNAGRTFATKAAALTGARLAFPDFAPDESGSDFNDWYLNKIDGCTHG